MESLAKENEAVTSHRIDLAELAFLNSITLFITDPENPAGETYAQKAVSLAEQVVEISQGETRDRHKLAKYYVNLAQFRSQAGDFEEAEQLILKGINQQRALVDQVPQYEEYRRLLAISMYRLSELYLSNDRPDEARQWIEACIEIRHRNRNENQQRYDHPLELALAYLHSGKIERKLGNVQPAMAAYRQAVAICEESIAAFPENEQFRVNAMTGLEVLVELCLEANDVENAKTLVASARQLYQRESKSDAPDDSVLATWKRIHDRWKAVDHPKN